MPPQSWKVRLQEARDKAVFEPLPTGAAPYAHRLEYFAEILDQVEVTRGASNPDSAAAILATAVILLLREQINGRLYTERMPTEPDRVGELCERLAALVDANGTRKP